VNPFAFSQTSTPFDPSVWAQFGPVWLLIGSLIFFLITLVIYFVRRDNARYEKMMDLLYESLKTNQSASLAQTVAHHALESAIEDVLNRERGRRKA
jgi:hypothetical protein